MRRRGERYWNAVNAVINAVMYQGRYRGKNTFDLHVEQDAIEMENESDTANALQVCKQLNSIKHTRKKYAHIL